MFLYLLTALMLAAGVHLALSPQRVSRKRIGEIGLYYVLIGYCGVPMLVISIANLLRPEWAPEMLGFPAGNPFQGFLGWAYLGMSILAVMCVWYRAAFLIGPAVIWAVFFAGATSVHLHDFTARGALTHGSMLGIFVSHGLISVLLVAALLASGLLVGSGGPATWTTPDGD